MRVTTMQAQVFDFGLTGKECQEVFDTQKYKNLAYGNAAGLKLVEKVREHWSEWLDIVEEAPWLRNWIRSPYYKDLSSMVDGYSGYRHAKIAELIYTEAVWGYGLDTWKESSTRIYSKAATAILKLQNVKHPNPARTYMWDDKIYRGCGLLVPCEFGELDRWLMGLMRPAQH